MMRSLKTKLLTVLLASCVTLGVVGCGGQNKGASNSGQNGGFYKGKNVTMIVPWSAGGGTDTDARTFAPYLEKELGCKIQVTNVTGGSGWVGWQQLLNGKADGLTVSVVNFPPVLVGYLNPKMHRKYTIKDFNFLCNFVSDSTVIIANKDEKRFTDMKSLVEYAKTHEVTYGSTGSGSDEGVLMYRLNAVLGTKFKEVPSKGAADARAAVQGGHVDVAGANVSEVKKLYDDKQIKVMAVFADKEDPLLKGVPTFDSLKLTSTSIINASNRGFAVKAGTSEAAVKEFNAAMDKIVKNPEIQKKLSSYGSSLDYKDSASFLKMIQEQETLLKGMSDVLGWNK